MFDSTYPWIPVWTLLVIAPFQDVNLGVRREVGVRVDLEGEEGDELGEEPLVHVLAHLVQHEPVANARIEKLVQMVVSSSNISFDANWKIIPFATIPAVHDIVLDVEGVLVVVHVAVHRHLHQEEPDVGGDDLGQPGDHPGTKKELFLKNGTEKWSFLENIYLGMVWEIILETKNHGSRNRQMIIWKLETKK